MDSPPTALRMLQPQQQGVTSFGDVESVIGRVMHDLTAASDESSVDNSTVVSHAYESMQQIPIAFATAETVHAFLAIARFYYKTSQAMAGVAPAIDAEAHARQVGDKSLIRKAVTFRGALHGDTANLPDATLCFSQALELAQQLSDVRAECIVWNNLGALLITASLTADAVACFERVVYLSEHDNRLADVRSTALANAALAALYERDFARSYQRCHQSLGEAGCPKTSDEAHTRAFLEGIFSRVFLGLGDPESARRHAAMAREFAVQSKLPRAELWSEIALGLSEIESSAVDVGLTRIQRMTELSRTKVRSTLVDTLTAAVGAYERAGQPDVALVYLHELLALNKESKAKQVLMHHQQHVARLQRAQPDEADAVDNQLRWHQGTLRGKLANADRERIKNLGQLVEQQAIAAERLDDTTGEHCYRVGRLASILGREVDLEEDVCFLIDLAARLHDIGKLIVPDAILLKPGKLSPGEREIMETHTVAGWEILGQTNIPQMHIAQEIARHHHERWDGTGYPDRMSSTAIPIAARVTALADVFDALTHVRPYKEAWPVADALAEIKRLRGRQFDPELTDVFLDLVPRLQREHGDLDRFLAAEAKHSPFIQARERIARALKGNNPDVSVFELRR